MANVEETHLPWLGRAQRVGCDRCDCCIGGSDAVPTESTIRSVLQIFVFVDANFQNKRRITVYLVGYGSITRICRLC